MYYGKNKEYKRSFKIAFRCFWDYDVRRVLLGEGNYNYKDKWYHFYWWNKKKVTKEYLKNFKDLSRFTWKNGSLWFS